MEKHQRFDLFLLILLPLGLILVAGIFPRPVLLDQAWKDSRISIAQGRYQAAIQALRIILDFQPDRVDLWESVARYEAKVENYSGAIQAYEQIRQRGMISNQGLYELANLYEQVGQEAEARSAWVEVSERPDLPADLFWAVVEHYRSKQDFDSARAVLINWAKSYPQDGQAYYLAGLFHASDQVDAANIYLMRAYELDSMYAGKIQRILQAFQQAASDPSPAYQKVVIGQALGEVGAWDLAEDAFLSAVKIEPGYAEAWAYLGLARMTQEKDGKPQLDTAKALNSNSDIVRSALVYYWRKQNEPDVALAYLNLIAQDHPNEGAWIQEIGATLAEKGELVQALNQYIRAVEIEPDNPQLWRALAVFATQHGFSAVDYGLPAAIRAYELDQDSAASLDVLGWVYLTQGQWEDAEQFLQQALKQDSWYASAYLHLGQVYIQKKMPDQAKTAWERAAKITDDNLIRLQAERLLEQYFPSQ